MTEDNFSIAFGVSGDTFAVFKEPTAAWVALSRDSRFEGCTIAHYGAYENAIMLCDSSLAILGIEGRIPSLALATQ